MLEGFVLLKDLHISRNKEQKWRIFTQIMNIQFNFCMQPSLSEAYNLVFLQRKFYKI